MDLKNGVNILNIKNSFQEYFNMTRDYAEKNYLKVNQIKFDFNDLEEDKLDFFVNFFKQEFEQSSFDKIFSVINMFWNMSREILDKKSLMGEIISDDEIRNIMILNIKIFFKDLPLEALKSLNTFDI